MKLNHTTFVCLVMTLISSSSCRVRSKEHVPNPVPQVVKGGDNGQVFTVESSVKGFSLAGKDQFVEIDLSIEQPKDISDAEQAPLPKCAQRFDAEFVVGQLSCVSEEIKDKAELRAKHTRQVCSAGHDSSANTEPSAKQPTIKSCTKAIIQMYQFLPALQVRLVARK